MPNEQRDLAISAADTHRARILALHRDRRTGKHAGSSQTCNARVVAIVETDHANARPDPHARQRGHWLGSTIAIAVRNPVSMWVARRATEKISEPTCNIVRDGVFDSLRFGVNAFERYIQQAMKERLQQPMTPHHRDCKLSAAPGELQ